MILRLRPVDCLSVEGLIAALNEAWTVERGLVRVWGRKTRLSRNAEACRIYWDHLTVTRAQKTRLESRLGEFGQEPSICRDGFARSLSPLFSNGSLPVDLMERELRMMRTSYSIAQQECAMYRALGSLAGRLGDHATASLAHESLEEEGAYSRRLWLYIEQMIRATRRSLSSPKLCSLAT